MSSNSPVVLTPEERTLFTSIPDDLSMSELAHYYTLEPKDKVFINKRRTPTNKLGVAMQLCTLRYPGRFLMNMESVSAQMVSFVAQQLGITPDALAEYGKREKTPYDHLAEIRDTYGYLACDKADIWTLVRYLLPLAMENNEALPLVTETMVWIRQHKRIAPPILTTEKVVWHVQRIARWRIYARLTRSLTLEQERKLSQLLVIDVKKDKTIPLTWIRLPAPKPSPEGMYHLLERIAFINDLRLPTRPDNVHLVCFRQLAQRGLRYQPQPLATLTNKREQQSLLIAYLNEYHQELIDQLIDMFDRWLKDLMRKGRNKQRHHLHRNITTLNRDLNTLAQAVAAFLDAKDKGTDPFDTVFAVVDEEVLTKTVASAHVTSRPADMDFRDLVENTYIRRRKAMLDMVRLLSFESIQDTHSGLEALGYILHLLDERDERVRTTQTTIDNEVVSAPMEHLKRKRWKRHALTEEGINPNYYELAALDRLQEGLRSGDIAVMGSHRYQAFTNYLLSETEWETMKTQERTRLVVTDDPQTYLNECQEKIKNLTQQVTNLLTQEDSHLSVKSSGALHLQRLSKITPEEAIQLRQQLYAYMPQVEMSQLILDIHKWTNVLDHFPHISTGRIPTGRHLAMLIATLMESGMNIGSTKMSQACPFSESELIHTAQWHIHEDALRSAIANLDNFVLHHPFSRHWGRGIASSSDGMRVPVRVNAANAVYNARHFWYRRGITIVSHSADIWMPFYPQVMQDNSEALYVIDALCHHETDFEIQEHYTDTASATYHLFALCCMLGFRFAPHIRQITKQYLYSVEPFEMDESLQSLFNGEIESLLVTSNWDMMRRLSASVRHGTASASLIMRKLASYPKQNQLAQAFREVGKLERTIFSLNYLLDTSLQRRSRVGLNKGEAIWSAARALNMKRDGDMSEREFNAQMNRASSTMLLVAMISSWNTIYLDKIVTALKSHNIEITDGHLQHVSPLGWEHVNLLGRYEFDLTQAYPLNALRPLRKLIG